MFRELSSDVTLLELILEVSSLKYCIHNTCCNFPCLEDAKRKRPHRRKGKCCLRKKATVLLPLHKNSPNLEPPLEKI